MKLEAVDKRNPGLIRPATIIGLDGHTIKIRYDGWSSDYDVDFDDDDYDIHPAGWCNRTGHPLIPPPGQSQPDQSISFEWNRFKLSFSPVVVF